MGAKRLAGLPGGRTPLFNALRRLFACAHVANHREGPSATELLEMGKIGTLSRRQFLKSTLAGAAAVSSSGLWTSCATPDRYGGPTAPRVVIVGAGIAGLNAAYQLRRASLRAEVYEGSTRTGGRIYSAGGVLAPQQVAELGGEFIDSNHEEMLALADEFGFKRIDVEAKSERALIKEAYFFDGHHRTAQELVRVFTEVEPRLTADFKALEAEVDFEKNERARQLDNTSLAQYLEQIGARGWLRELLEVAFVTEFDLDADEQSSLNMLSMKPAKVGASVAVLGESDERYRVLGGNQQICHELARRLGDQIHLSQRLVRIKQNAQDYTLTFQSANAPVQAINADFVILTLPFTLLREVELNLELPDEKRRAIRELGYGNCAKVLAGFSRRHWRDLGYAGPLYSDEPFQLVWDNSRQQPGDAGGLTFYSGGRAALAAGQGTASDQTEGLLPGVEKAFPGLSARRNGKTARFHWPTYPWSKAAYASYRVGQWSTIAGVEGQSVGNIFFAGEHCSEDFQGFMNGGAQTGKDAASAVLTALKKQRRSRRSSSS